MSAVQASLIAFVPPVCSDRRDRARGIKQVLSGHQVSRCPPALSVGRPDGRCCQSATIPTAPSATVVRTPVWLRRRRTAVMAAGVNRQSREYGRQADTQRRWVAWGLRPAGGYPAATPISTARERRRARYQKWAIGIHCVPPDDAHHGAHRRHEADQMVTTADRCVAGPAGQGCVPRGWGRGPPRGCRRFCVINCG